MKKFPQIHVSLGNCTSLLSDQVENTKVMNTKGSTVSTHGRRRKEVDVWSE